MKIIIVSLSICIDFSDLITGVVSFCRHQVGRALKVVNSANIVDKRLGICMFGGLWNNGRLLEVIIRIHWQISQHEIDYIDE